MAKSGEASVKRINLALQGGGAHGAFTWGVLDRLLSDERIAIDGLSGTSAGAMNAALVVDGWARGGRDGAREALDTFWRRIGDAGRFSPLAPSPIERWFGGWSYDRAPAFAWFDAMTRFLSPYQTNPFNYNPLRRILERSIEFDCLRACTDMRLFISATNVRKGKNRIFTSEEIDIDVLLASACLPHLFHAVEIGEQSYWDGGFLGNPALYPLIYNCQSRDIVIVQINPLEILETPRSAAAILDRMNDISFNAALIAEIRAIDFVGRQLDQHRLQEGRYKHMLLHMIEAEGALREFGYASKIAADRHFLEHLRGIGERAADAWLAANFERLGAETTLPVERFLSADQRQPARVAGAPSR
ncbi:MAG: patatin-like phospholipase family protein [Alphaproteobacteria bacterium]|nr:patatin-like phospholipase family protein [Alphaproteobacteria bacterium]